MPITLSTAGGRSDNVLLFEGSGLGAIDRRDRSLFSWLLNATDVPRGWETWSRRALNRVSREYSEVRVSLLRGSLAEAVAVSIGRAEEEALGVAS